MALASMAQLVGALSHTERLRVRSPVQVWMPIVPGPGTYGGIGSMPLSLSFSKKAMKKCPP